MLSPCGLLCTDCEYLNQSCNGCDAVQGSPFWTLEIFPDKICPLYRCAIKEKEYDSCGQCPELPCRSFNELKDPDITMEQHIKSVEERVARLKGKYSLEK